MQRTLIDRFRGVLLGAVVGNSLGAQTQGKSYQERRWQQSAWSTISDSPPPLLPAVLLMLYGARSLVDQGRWVAQDWSNLCQKVLGDRASDLTNAEIAIAELPIALFFHEENTKQQQQLQQAFAILKGNAIDGVWHKDSEFLAVQMIGGAIADLLKERFEPTIAIAQMLKQTETIDALWFDQLRQIQTFLENRISLDAVRRDLLKAPAATNQGNSIISALYSFLATPEEFRLSLLRGALVSDQPELTCTLVGALSGAYNGWSGIPAAWRVVTPSLPSIADSPNSDFFIENPLPPLLPHRKKPLTSEIVQLADLLLAAWSGVFAPGTIVVTDRQVPAIAAPSVIRSQPDSETV